MILYALYKKHHWLVAGPTFYQLHLLFDKHAEEQAELIDLLAERVQSLGGIAVGDPRHAAELTTIPRPPDGAEEVAVDDRPDAAGPRGDHREGPRGHQGDRGDGGLGHATTCSWATSCVATSSRSGSCPSTSSTSRSSAADRCRGRTHRVTADPAHAP